MSLQTIIVLIIIAAAVVYSIKTIRKQTRTFSTKNGCEADCGCNGASKKIPS